MKSKEQTPHYLSRNGPTVTQALAEKPKLSPRQAALKTYPKPFIIKRLLLRFQIKHDLYKGRTENDLTKEDLDEAERSGKFPYRPSDLFLKIYSDVLLCLARDPLSGLVSPPLMGSSAVMPLSIISVIPDIMKHYAHCIENAERQVLLATNYLQPSDSHKIVFEALKNLSKKVGERGQKEKVVVKLIYDRGTPMQVFKNHVAVLPGSKGWKEVELPDPSEIPNLELEVINFHRVILGTFHAKFMVVDQKLCLLSSNNIQDRPNVEMMIHLEGPVIDSFVDTFVLSWHNAFKPMPPSILDPTPPPSSGFTFDGENPFLRDIDLDEAARAARALLKEQGEGDRQNTSAVKRHRNEWQGAFRGMGFGVSSPPSQVTIGRHDSKTGFADVVDAMMQKHGIGHPQKNGSANGTTSCSPTSGEHPNGDSPTVVKSESGVNEKGPESQAPEPQKEESAEKDANGIPEPTESKIQEEPQRPPAIPLDHDESTNTSQSPSQPAKSGQESEAELKKRRHALSQALNAGTIRKADATIEDDTLLEDFRPHLIHKPHDPFPIAVVNRKPHGMPGHQDVRTPQNAAWLAAFRYAKNKVFIQSPTLNASPVVRACIEAARRSVKVILYLGLGFNDKGESIPFQGGTNQEVVVKMYKELKKNGKEEFLDVYWYTGKDQIRPINAIYKSRNCHVKFMVVDDEVGIQGNGNMDTQSWFHSQEVNVLVDSKQIVREWMDALEANQNTSRYGKVDRDGIWRDSLKRTVSFYDDEVTEREKKQKDREEKKAKPADDASKEKGGKKS